MDYSIILLGRYQNYERKEALETKNLVKDYGTKGFHITVLRSIEKEGGQEVRGFFLLCYLRQVSVYDKNAGVEK